MAGNGGDEAAKAEDPLVDVLPAADTGSLPDATPAAPALAEPLRDDQVSQAVSFLTNPKVRSVMPERQIPAAGYIRAGIRLADVQG